jgi:chromosome segregation ATPase
MLGPATSITDYYSKFPPVTATMAAPSAPLASTDWVAFNAASTRISQYASQLAETVEAAASIPTDIEVVQAELRRVEEQSTNAMLLQLLQGLGGELKEMRQEMQELKDEIREQQNTKRELKNEISGQIQKTKKDLQFEIDQTEKNLKWKMENKTDETKAEVAKMRNGIQTMTRDMQQSMRDMRSEMHEVMKQLKERKTTNDDQPRMLGNNVSQIKYASDSDSVEDIACS